MAAGGVIGARTVLAGVDEFLSSIRTLSDAFGGIAVPIGQANTAAGGAAGGFDTFNRAINQVGQTANTVSRTVSTLTLPVRTIGSVIGTVADEVEAGGGKIVGSLKGVGDALTDLTEKGLIGVGGVGAALTSLAATAITESAKYQRGMKDIEAVSQTTGPALDLVDEAIRRVGSRFPESIGEIQKAALELAKAGVPIEAIKTQVLDLTVALQQLSGGELTSEQAAEGIGANLKLFERSFNDAGNTAEQASARIANSVTAVANVTRAQIPEVFNALAKAGPNFAVLDEDIEHTAAAVALLVGAGLRGNEAGTSLANFAQRLENPSRDALKIARERNISLFEVDTGKARPFIDVLSDIADLYSKDARAASGMTDEVANAELAELFQTRTLRGVNLELLRGVDAYRDYLAEIAKTDVIRQAGVQNQALLRQLEILRNNAQLAGVAFGRDFVEGLTRGVTSLNDFLRTGERAQAVAGVIGKAAASILTGQEADQARAAVHDSPFGDEGTRNFDTLSASADLVRGTIGRMIDDGRRLATTLAGIVFPDGPADAVATLTGLLNDVLLFGDRIINKFNEVAPGVTRALQTITGADTFQDLIKNAEDFGQQISDIFTENGGDESFKRLSEAAVDFLATVRKESGPVIIELAKLGRAIEDNGPAFIKAGGIIVQVMGTITTAVIGAATEVVRLVGLLARGVELRGQLGQFPIPNPFSPADVGATFGAGVGRQFAEDIARQRAETAAAENGPTFGLADRAIARDLARQGRETLPPDTSTGPSLAERFTEERSPAEIALSADAIQAETSALQENTDAQGENAEARKKTTGGINRPDTKEIERQAKALEDAQKTLSNQFRTLEKDSRDVQATFEKTIDGARRRWLDGMEQIAQSTADAFKRIDRTAREARDRALESFNIQTERSGGFAISISDTGEIEADLTNQIQGSNTIFRQGQEDAKRIFSQGQEDRKTLRSIEAEDITRDATRQIAIQEREETRGQERLTTIRRRGIEDAERDRAEDIQDALTQFSRGQERELQTFQQGVDTRNTQRLRTREDKRLDEQLARDLGAATTPADRTRILQAFTEQKRVLTERRKDEDEDAQISRAQQLELTTFRQTQEDAFTKHKRDIEDGEVAHRRDLENADLLYRQGLEDQLVSYRQGLEDKETARRRTAQATELQTVRTQDQPQQIAFDRQQQADAERFRFINERLPDFQRTLRDIDRQRNDAIENQLDSTLRETLRTSNTLNRAVEGGLEAAGESGRRLLERFDNEAAALIQRAPGIKPELDQKRAVLEAEIAIANARTAGQGTSTRAEIDAANQAVIDRVRGLLPDSDINRALTQFTDQPLVTTRLVESPQIDRLTKALDDLTNRINQTAPITIEQLNTQPGETITIGGGRVGRGTIGPVGASV